MVAFRRKRLREVKAPSEKQIEDLLAANIEILDAGWLVIGRQVKTEGGGFIDILCIDLQGALVVVELKRELTPREVTAQALDYASCVSVFTGGPDSRDLHGIQPEAGAARDA